MIVVCVGRGVVDCVSSCVVGDAVGLLLVMLYG